MDTPHAALTVALGQQHPAGLSSATQPATADTDTDPGNTSAAPHPETAAAAPPAGHTDLPAPYRRTNGFRPDATNEWDRMPVEIQGMILDAASPFTKFVNGLLLRAEMRGLREHQREQVWQDAIDVDWQGDLQLLPHVDITTTGIAMSPSVLERIKPWQKADDYARVVIRNRWIDMLDFDKADVLATSAAREGAIWLLEDLVDLRRAVVPSVDLAEHAALGGHLDTARFLHDRLPGEQWHEVIGFKAAQSGNLDLVVWLGDHHPECLGPSAFDGAAHGNHMHVVRWLAEHRTLRCGGEAFVSASIHANLEMLQYLHELYPDGLNEAGPRLVSADIHVLDWISVRRPIDQHRLVAHIFRVGEADALIWAADRFNLNLSENTIIHAVMKGHNNLLKHVYKGGVAFTSVSAAIAATYGNVGIMSWVMQRDRRAITMLVEATASSGDSLLVEWWRMRHGIVFGQRELETAIREYNHKLVKYLLTIEDVEWDLNAARKAADRLVLLSTSLNTAELISSIRESIDAAASRGAATAQPQASSNE
ncbi:hypothetical protein HK105_203140 [Polyrhizophydium stewartii]|uniref:Ankyrin repeat protein n=1 Tax=Polyrhizophydium stewartii TaxID=2732419 RepID=A0ABR4NDB2_9FUNG